MKTKGEVLYGFQRRGETVSDWAKRHGFNRRTVYAVLAGQMKATRGIGHKIAVMLEMKAGFVTSGQMADDPR